MEHAQGGCGSCGRPFAVADRFCPQCGRPILREDRERAAGWETCVIRLRRVSAPLVGAWRWRFVAEARRPGPPTIVAESPVFAARTTVTKRTLTRLAYQAPPPGEAARAARAVAGAAVGGGGMGRHHGLAGGIRVVRPTLPPTRAGGHRCRTKPSSLTEECAGVREFLRRYGTTDRAGARSIWDTPRGIVDRT